MKKLLSLLALILVSSIGFFANAQTAYVESYALNLRSGPTNDSQVLRTLSKGDAVTILDSSWGRKLVSTSDGLEGYVYSIFLSEEFITPIQAATTNANQYRVTEFRANVRTIGNILRPVAILGEGDIVKVIDNKLYLNHRIKVEVMTSSTLGYYVGRTGYISKNVVEQVGDDVYTVPEIVMEEEIIEEEVVVEEEIIEEEVIEEEIMEEEIVEEEVMEEERNQVSEEDANSENTTEEEDFDLDDFDLESLFKDL